jgi:hypothetical protein
MGRINIKFYSVMKCNIFIPILTLTHPWKNNEGETRVATN